MATELYKRFRPPDLKRMIGNVITVQTLQNMLDRDTVPHTILLHGPSGCGKTTLARILKNELECSEMDFKELNCSDERGVDTIRKIRREMNMMPTGGKCRIYLLDEVHQMTKDAQNAALKILEDTPKHVYFILCTTDPQKIIPTIKTRCCQLEVELLNTANPKKLVQRVLKREKAELSEDLILDLVDAAGGSARKALVILDRVLNLPNDAREGAIKDNPEDRGTMDLCRAIMKGDSWTRIAKILKELKEDPEKVRYSVLGYFQAVLLNKGDERAANVIEIFSSNFYDSKKAGLVLACWEAVVGFGD